MRRPDLGPLRERDFRLLFLSSTISFTGSAFATVALAFAVLDLTGSKADLGFVLAARTLPTVVFLLVGGVVSDRFDRRLVMVWADVLRAAAVGGLAVLVLMGALRFWELVALVAVYGIGTAFFTPAFEAIVPELVPSSDLPAANSLDQLIRPIALRLLGPVVGGALIALGTGLAFAVDAGSFAFCLLSVLALRRVPQARPAAEVSTVAALKEGLWFVRRRVWLWGTLLSAAITYLVFLGPAEVLLPFVVKNDLHGSAGTLGLVLAAGGVGAVGGAAFMGHAGHPRRDVTVMYLTWTVATFAIAGYGIATAAWQLMAACLVFNALEAAGTIVWATIKQRHVPASMLGRVSSLDWLISIGLLPVSFALTAPVAGAIGARATLVGAAAIGGVVTFAALFLPGMRDIEGGSEGGPEAPAFAELASPFVR